MNDLDNLVDRVKASIITGVQEMTITDIPTLETAEYRFAQMRAAFERVFTNRTKENAKAAVQAFKRAHALLPVIEKNQEGVFDK